MSQFECVRCGKGENECWCKRAQPQAPAPSLDARGDLSEQEIVELDERVAGAKATGWGNAWRWAERLLAEVKRRRAAPSAPSDALREAWIKGCMAGREEGAGVAWLHGDGLDGDELAEAIRSLPAPHRSEGAAAMKRRCESYEGCAGLGWLWDSCDSGSGRQVYCECPAGIELRLSDALPVPEKPTKIESGAAPREEKRDEES